MENLLLIVGIIGAVFVVVVLPVGSAAVKIVQEYERGVIFRLGRLIGPKGPGLFFIIPFIDRMVRIDLRVVTLEIPPQEIITRDNITMKVSAVLYFYVVNPNFAVTHVANFGQATFQIAQTTLRSVLGQSDMDELLAQRTQINLKLQEIIDEQTEPWGIKVSTVEVKDVELPESMKRVMAKQAEAEREKRAKIIHAEGEFQAAQTLANAAHVINSEESALQLRYLQTLAEISVEKNSTVILTDIGGLLSRVEGWFTNGNGRKNGATAELPVASAGRILAESQQPVEARS